jgi:hypothetical protein
LEWVTFSHSLRLCRHTGPSAWPQSTLRGGGEQPPMLLTSARTWSQGRERAALLSSPWHKSQFDCILIHCSRDAQMVLQPVELIASPSLLSGVSASLSRRRTYPDRHRGNVRECNSSRRRNLFYLSGRCDPPFPPPPSIAKMPSQKCREEYPFVE